jgi:hypothetical protein
MTRFTTRTLATLSLWAGFGLSAFAQIPTLTLDKAFETRPRQPGVTVPTPSPDQIARHKIEPIKDKNQATIGYVVRDAEGKPVRQFVSYDNRSFNIVAFYLNGQEAYRETYPPDPKDPYQFRWLGPNGGKWGLDKDRDGKVDEWVVISPEEASQELLGAVTSRDPKRLEALLATDENLKGIGLPPAEIARIKEKSAGAGKRLGEAAAALKLSPEARWVHLELSAPQTTAADAFNGRDDQIVHKNGTIVIQDGKETKLLQTGELLMVNRAWKLVEGPAVGHESAPGGQDDTPQLTPEIEPLVRQLDELDKQAPMLPPEKMPEYYGKRVAILEQIVAKLEPKQQTGWAKLLIDSLANAAESAADANPNPALARLKQLKDTFVAAAQNPLGPYAAFRLIGAEHGLLMAKTKTADDIHSAQDKHRAALEAFVGAYPKSADASEAAMQLARSFDFSKDGEAKAKQWCEYLVKNFPGDSRVPKAAGIIKRLECEGKTLELAGTNMATGQPFNAQQLAGKAIVVYYWASWSQSLGDDAKKLKELAAAYGPKGLEIICVALDDKSETAGQWIQKVGLPGTHLHAGGGIDASPLAASYGILVAPHVFLVGKDGKIVSRNGQMFTLEDAVKKLITP